MCLIGSNQYDVPHISLSPAVTPDEDVCVAYILNIRYGQTVDYDFQYELCHSKVCVNLNVREY